MTELLSSLFPTDMPSRSIISYDFDISIRLLWSSVDLRMLLICKVMGRTVSLSLFELAGSLVFLEARSVA